MLAKSPLNVRQKLVFKVCFVKTIKVLQYLNTQHYVMTAGRSSNRRVRAVQELFVTTTMHIKRLNGKLTVTIIDDVLQQLATSSVSGCSVW